MTWFHGYLVTVSREPRVESVAFLGNKVATEVPENGTLVTVYDLKGKYIAFKDDFGTRKFDPYCSKAIGEPIKHVICDFGEIIVVTAENKFYKLVEFDLAHKLDILFQKDLYNLALSLVLQPPSSIKNVGKMMNIQETVEKVLKGTDEIRITVMDICKRFGDYLYSKQDYESAMGQYIRTIGYLEPSYIIRKFLDAQKILGLTLYLKALHDRHLANGDHTTLLLNCYTKLNDIEHINEFIEISDSFDVQTAISVCTSSGFHQQALAIASKFEEHELYVKVLVVDLKQYDEAISYLVNLSDFQNILLRFGYLLVSNRPEKTTRIILERFTEFEISVHDLISYYVVQPSWCVVFLTGFLKVKYGIYLDEPEKQDPVENFEGLQEVCGNLLDIQLALRHANRSLPTGPVDWDDKIKTFLQSPFVRFDLENALFLCRQHQFRQGELIIYERLGLYSDCLQYYMEINDFDKMMSLCRDYGKQDHGLWKLAFEYCSRSCRDHTLPDERSIKVLGEIESRKLMTHSEIIQMLAQNEFITLGMIRPFLLTIINQDMALISKVFNY